MKIRYFRCTGSNWRNTRLSMSSMFTVLVWPSLTLPAECRDDGRSWNLITLALIVLFFRDSCNPLRRPFFWLLISCRHLQQLNYEPLMQFVLFYLTQFRHFLGSLNGGRNGEIEYTQLGRMSQQRRAIGTLLRCWYLWRLLLQQLHATAREAVVPITKNRSDSVTDL